MFLDKGEEETKKEAAKPKQFIPRAVGQKVTIRLVDGRPLIAKLEAHNNYELLLDVGTGKKIIVFKNAIITWITRSKKKAVERPCRGILAGFCGGSPHGE